MQRRILTSPLAIVLILILQLIPLVLLPPEFYASGSQEWWLSALLVLMVVIADIYIMVRRTTAPWPWYLVSFAHGFNIIARLMLIFSHAKAAGVAGAVDANYLILSAVAMALSAYLLWYTELAEVRMAFLKG